MCMLQAMIMKYTNIYFLYVSVISSVLLGIEDLQLSSIRNSHLKVMRENLFP